MLVTVLVITAIGLLFGAGALLLFRYQCQLRIDRQHELEKVYAVRSALNYIGNYADKISLDGTMFGYHTTSERNLNLFVKPVDRIFPDLDNPAHLDMRNDGGNNRVFREVADQYSSQPDYEYGWSGTTCQDPGIKNYYDSKYGLLFPLWYARQGAKWWVNVGMPGTGGWLEDKYGRRYFFEPRNHVTGSASNDVMRLAIIRDDRNNAMSPLGHRHGWPLDHDERAIVLEFRPFGGGANNANGNANVVITLSEYLGTYSPSAPAITNIITWSDNIPAVNLYVGVQLAGDRVTLFYSQKQSGTVDKMLRGWTFYPDVEPLTRETYDYFMEGSAIDAEGRVVSAPDLRVVLEVEAGADSRPLEEKENNESADEGTNGNINDFLTDFRVTPAYQFDVFLEHPVSVTNRATVAQRVLLNESTGVGHAKCEYAVRTYDTHGTENKGFRKDEKDWAAKRRGGN